MEFHKDLGFGQAHLAIKRSNPGKVPLDSDSLHPRSRQNPPLKLSFSPFAVADGKEPTNGFYLWAPNWTALTYLLSIYLLAAGWLDFITTAKGVKDTLIYLKLHIKNVPAPRDLWQPSSVSEWLRSLHNLLNYSYKNYSLLFASVKACMFCLFQHRSVFLTMLLSYRSTSSWCESLPACDPTMLSLYFQG